MSENEAIQKYRDSLRALGWPRNEIVQAVDGFVDGYREGFQAGVDAGTVGMVSADAAARAVADAGRR